MNGFTFVALIALAVGIGIAYRAGAIHARRASQSALRARLRHSAAGSIDMTTQSRRLSDPSPCAETPPGAETPLGAPPAQAESTQLLAFAEDRRRLFGELADARAETARYRQIVVDIERNAPPPLLDAPGTPDDLKLIVGVGPVIERMLYQMGIGTYRQIARWSEREIDDVDARLPEFRGRIRRDGWVTQARALHVGKYGTDP